MFQTKSEAQGAGRRTALRERVEHLIHNRSGEVRESTSYGGDPSPPKG